MVHRVILVKYLLKKTQCKGRLISKVMGKVCNSVSEKEKHADYPQALFILNRLTSESDDLKPIFHRSQAQYLFNAQSS